MDKKCEKGQTPSTPAGQVPLTLHRRLILPSKQEDSIRGGQCGGHPYKRGIQSNLSETFHNWIDFGVVGKIKRGEGRGGRDYLYDM